MRTRLTRQCGHGCAEYFSKGQSLRLKSTLITQKKKLRQFLLKNEYKQCSNMFPCINVQQNMTDEKVYFLVIYLSEKIIRAETVYFIKTTFMI